MMMKQSQRQQISKSNENPNFSKIKEQIMKQSPIQIKYIYSQQPQQPYKPSTPQQNSQNSAIRVSNQRPQSSGNIKPPIVSNQNRISDKILPNNQDNKQNLQKSIKDNSINLKEMTFGIGQTIDFNQQSFNKSFNKFNNGILLQSMRLSKEQIEENNNFLNGDMREQDNEEEEDFENEHLIKTSIIVEKKPIFQEKQIIESNKPLFQQKPSIEYNKPNLKEKQNIEYKMKMLKENQTSENQKPSLKEKPSVECNKPILKEKCGVENNKTLLKEKQNIEHNKILTQQFNQQKQQNQKNKQLTYIPITNESKLLKQTTNINQKQQFIINRPQSGKVLKSNNDNKQPIVNRPQSGKILSNPVISPQINNQKKTTLKAAINNQYVNNQVPSPKKINYQKQSSVKRPSSGKQDKQVASVPIKNIVKQQSSQLQRTAQFKKF